MGRIEIMVEEPSMEECLKELLPKIVPKTWKNEENYFIRKHQGKSDLQKSIREKVRVFNNWHEPVAIIILHDQDSADCKILKNDLLEKCGDHTIPILIRIVCRELESWYLGDLSAVEKAYPCFNSNKYIGKAPFRNPDILNAKDKLKKILPEYKEIASSREISKFMDVQQNRSISFNLFVSGIQTIFNHETFS
jgi:hypothetical protein